MLLLSNIMVFDSSIRRTLNARQPVWLTALQNDLALITTQVAQRYWPAPGTHSGPYFNYRLEHVQQVEREALGLIDAPGSDLAALRPDREIILAAVWIHDRCQPQYEGERHAARAADWAGENLAALGFPAEKTPAVVFAVAHHADAPNTLTAEAVEARILWDADKLTKLGPLAVINTLMSHAAFPEQRASYTSIALEGLEQLERSRRIIKHFYFEQSRALAYERYAQQKAFYELLSRDVEA
jgi:predicted metal-dependent HD superfamily phosphohydrolase